MSVPSADQETWPTERVETLFGPMEAVKDDLITRQLVRFGAHQRNELAMLLAFLRRGDHVLDIGAHIGTFTLPLADRVGAGGRVDAFEPLPQHLRILRTNVEARDWAHVHCHHALIGGGDGKRLQPSIRPGNSAETLFTEVPENEPARDSPAGPRHWTLDQWWRLQGSDVDLIKIDVEGMELEVLRGGEALLSTCRPMLYLEVHRRHLRQRNIPLLELEDFLRRHGYHFFRNLGRRNGRQDRYVLGRHRRLRHGGPFFDVLAIHAQSDHYPEDYLASTLSRLWVIGRQAVGHGRRTLRGWFSTDP